MLLLWDRRDLRDARCQMPEFRDFSSGAPRIREHFMRQNPSVGVAACKLTRQESSGLSHSARSQWEKLPTRGACRKREAPAQDYSKHIGSSIYTVIGHLQQEGSDQALCACSCCTTHLRYRHHLLGCGSNKQVIMLRSKGLGVPLGGSRGLGSASGGHGSASGGLWGPCGCKIR